jgi:HNH endonuclease
MPRSSLNVEKRFWRYVHKTPSCWRWTGSTVNGYGQFSVNGRTVPAHAYSFFMHNGHWAQGDVCHSRDCVRDCVRPDHLRDGTHAENMRIVASGKSS